MRQPHLLRHGGMVRETELDIAAACFLADGTPWVGATEEPGERRPIKYGRVYGKGEAGLYESRRLSAVVRALDESGGYERFFFWLPRKALYLTSAKYRKAPGN